MRIMRQKKQILYWLLPLMGTAFALWYVKNATADVVYSDYIRLVNSYLPDVWNPAKFFVPDVLTRIPVSYLARIVNVELFGFSVTFERVLGVLSLGLSGAVFGLYCRERRVGFLWFALLSAVMFSQMCIRDRVYVLNDFSFSSIASENTKEEKKEILIKGLEIVKKSLK